MAVGFFSFFTLISEFPLVLVGSLVYCIGVMKTELNRVAPAWYGVRPLISVPATWIAGDRLGFTGMKKILTAKYTLFCYFAA